MTVFTVEGELRWYKMNEELLTNKALEDDI